MTSRNKIVFHILTTLIRFKWILFLVWDRLLSDLRCKRILYFPTIRIRRCILLLFCRFFKLRELIFTDLRAHINKEFVLSRLEKNQESKLSSLFETLLHPRNIFTYFSYFFLRIFDNLRNLRIFSTSLIH